MRTRRSTGSYEVGRAKRAEIIEVAAAKFGAAGYYKTPLAQIAADVGLSEGGLMYHFPSKKRLLLAVAEHRFDQTAHWWSGVGPASDPFDIFRGMVVSSLRFEREPGLIELFVLLSAESADITSPSHALFAERYERTITDLAALLHSGAERGVFRADADYLAIARETIAVRDGLQLQWVISGGKVELARGVRDHALRVLSSIVTDASTVGPDLLPLNLNAVLLP
ncbi:TetR/AcrR family transcriptional regulator [Lysinibacter cavernae]|uniref:AcrR family transcriptional regulator n=1 Tax=Lysinibacter cavernae TaxID=1640652 RepID=A0A7X5R2C5_9MICO|nr:TetR/AcrR family transcriptional regulator [Lysinibacter cavernae]NIH54389.1 AcrR family transcriptional regulator [Lysinibacter cavernae]